MSEGLLASLFALACLGGIWCLVRFYVMTLRLETEAAITYLAIGAVGYVVGGIGVFITLFG